jgi:hypothetical protein
MSHDTTDIRRHLAQIAATPRDRPPLDVARSAARGRHILRVRRASAVAASAVAVGLIGSLAAFGLARPGAQGGRTSSDPSTYPNPIVQRAVVGWLPAGYVVHSVTADDQNGGHDFQLVSVMPRGSNGNWLGYIRLTDYGTGPEPPLGYEPGGRLRQRTPAAPVKGKQAYWLARPGSADEVTLRWQYRPRSWAELDAQGTASQAGNLYRIAESITFGTARPTAFPFRVSGLPPGLAPSLSTGSTRGGSDTLASVDLALGPDTLDNRLEISVTVPDPSSHPVTVGTPSREITLDGHHATERRSASSRLLIVHNVNGLDLTLQASGPTLKRLDTIGGIVGLYRRITVLGTDPSRWTVAPLS